MTQSKKVVLAVLITLLIAVLAVSCFVVLPSTVSGVAQAASETVDIVPPSVETQHDHADGSWIELTQANISEYISETDSKVRLGSGNYYLGEDITLTDTIINLDVAAVVTLCLNGNVLRFDAQNYTSGYINCAYADFTLCDCNTSTAHLYYQATIRVDDYEPYDTYHFVVDDGSPEFDAAYASASMRGTIYGGVLEGVKDLTGDTSAVYGVVRTTGSATKPASFTMNGGTITGVYHSSVASSSRNTGAILAIGGQVVINGGAVVGNGGAKYGGCAIVSFGANITINDGLFAYNCAPGSYSQQGGAIFVSRGANTLNINGGEIRNNYSNGISTASTLEDLTINDTLIADNAAQAIYLYYDCNVTLNGCTISGNNKISQNYMGSIGSYGGKFEVNDCTITDNYGGITSPDITINNTTISNNTFGGVRSENWYEGTRNSVVIKGSTITGNSGDTAALYLVGADVTLEDCTITDNTCVKGGLYVCDVVLVATNCTVTGNTGSNGKDMPVDMEGSKASTITLHGGEYGDVSFKTGELLIGESETLCNIQSLTLPAGTSISVLSGASAQLSALSIGGTINVDGTLTLASVALSYNVSGDGQLVLASGASLTIDSGKTIDCDVHLTQDAQFVMSAGKFGGVLSSAEDFAGTNNISGGNFAVPQQESLLPEGNIMVLLQSGDSGYDADYPYIVMPANTEGTINSIIVAWQTTEFTYNGKVLDASTAGVTITDGEGNPIEQAYTVEYSYVLDGVTYYGLPKNVGTYDLTVKLYFKSETDAYTAEGAVSGIVILPKEVEVIWGKTTTFTYDGQAHAPTAQVPFGVIIGDDIGISVQGATNAGTHTAEATITNGNYVLANPECQYTINKKVVEAVWGDNVTFVYNGQSQAPTATADSGIEGVQVDVTVAGNTNAGDYTATATDNSGNFELTNATLNYTIAKKRVAVVWSNTELTYTGEAISPTATVDTGIAGDTLTLTISGGQTKNGTYIAFATTDNANYELTNSSVQFTIAGGPQGGGMSGLATAMLIITIVCVLGAAGFVGVVLVKNKRG